MINYDHIMVRFGELNTKGKNKKEFIRILAANIKSALKEWPNLTLETRYDHIYVGLNNTPYQEVLERLQEVSGIHALSLVYRCTKDVDVIKESALALIKEEKGQTFKVKVKRGDKTFPLISDEITRIVAGHILRNCKDQARIEMGGQVQSVIVPKGNFYNFTHGAWVFRLNESHTHAVRVPVSIGRQNPRHFEILEGLNPGDEIIITGYDRIADADEVVLN